MGISQNIRKSCRKFQQSLARLADQSFGKAVPAAHDEMARGEFMSAFISDQGLNLPATRPERTRR